MLGDIDADISQFKQSIQAEQAAIEPSVKVERNILTTLEKYYSVAKKMGMRPEIISKSKDRVVIAKERIEELLRPI